MPPIKRQSPRKGPVAGKDDITEWENQQPVVTLVRDENDDSEDYFPSGDETPPVEASRPEVRPKIPSPIAVKARSLATRAKEIAKPAKRPAKQRVSVDKLIGGAWQMFAQLAAPINLPVAKVLDMQAPVAGMLLEDVVKNTVVDRVLQPIARLEAGGEIAFALMGPPLLVAVLTQRPQTAPIIVPILRQSLMSWIEIAGPKLAAVEKKEKAFQEQYGQRIDEMISYFLAEPSPNGANPANTVRPDTATAPTA